MLVSRKFLVFLLFCLMVFGLFNVASAKITINYWHYLSGDYAEVHEPLIQEFNAQHPDIHVEA